jgi:hypothetical protein
MIDPRAQKAKVSDEGEAVQGHGVATLQGEDHCSDAQFCLFSVGLFTQGSERVRCLRVIYPPVPGGMVCQ